jgi:hypothetical protein
LGFRGSSVVNGATSTFPHMAAFIFVATHLDV